MFVGYEGGMLGKTHTPFVLSSPIPSLHLNALALGSHIPVIKRPPVFWWLNRSLYPALARVSGAEDQVQMFASKIHSENQTAGWLQHLAFKVTQDSLVLVS